MATRSFLAIVLAAGEGKRMKSATPKVMHKIGGLPMLGHVLSAVAKGGATETAVVIGVGAEAVAAYVKQAAPSATTHIQHERLGTGNATLAAKAALTKGADDVIVILGDAPMVKGATLAQARAELAAGHDIVVVGFRPADPKGYGRLIEEGGRLVAIVEEKDATAEQRRVGFVNSGIIAFRGQGLVPMLEQIGKGNAQNQYYLTDTIAMANKAGKKVKAIEAHADEVSGVNDRTQLSHAEGVFQRVMRETAMENGVTMLAPSTVWFSYDTELGSDVVLEPNVFFGPGVKVANGVTIRANSHIEGATIATGAIIGPFARLRPGADIGADAHVGNFVEVKNTTIGEGAKANHLSYLGDAEIGARTNIGAGTITCNYDGFDKHRTTIGEGVFVGSNTALVAPVNVGDGANIAAGSVITHDVAADALAVARATQVDKPDWARKYRERKATEKAGRKKK